MSAPMDVDEDEIISTLPIHYSNALAPFLQLHQFPLLNRPLQVPPSAAQSGKQITSRIKPQVKKIEIHVPTDVRPDVWNKDKGAMLGQARLQDDREKNQLRENSGTGEPRLSETRLSSTIVSQKGVHLLGVVRDGHLHLHPIDETHQLRPTLTYLDVLNRKVRRSGAGDNSDSDDGPPPDPDEAPVAPQPKKEKKAPEAKEVSVTARRASDGNTQGGLSAARREILQIIHKEEDDEWQVLEFRDVTAPQSEAAFEKVFSTTDKELTLTSNMTTFLNTIPGL